MLDEEIKTHDKMKRNPEVTKITAALNEVAEYAESINYELVLKSVDCEEETVEFLLRRNEIVSRNENYHTKRWYERGCCYRYSTQTWNIGTEEYGECTFDQMGYQIDGEYRF